jgi:ribonuclease HI
VEYPEESALNIYTDGSMLAGPRRGGAGLLFIAEDSEGNEESYEQELPGFAGATQNQMELEAVIQGLRMATGRRPPFDRSRYRKIVVKTDATYVAENFGTAISFWSRNGWTTKEGKPVDNAKQWKELVRLAVLSSKQGKPVKIVWVPGKKSPRTKAVDKLAKRSARKATKRQLNPSEVRRKKTDKPIEIGVVEMEGQLMTINIFKSESSRCTDCRSTPTRSSPRRAPTTIAPASSTPSFTTCAAAPTASGSITTRETRVLSRCSARWTGQNERRRSVASRWGVFIRSGMV